jgi:hypothetical protein
VPLAQKLMRKRNATLNAKIPLVPQKGATYFITITVERLVEVILVGVFLNRA